MDSPYHGQDLSRGEIRLLTVVSTEPGLELSTERHSLAEDLEFEAVSYVWGTAPATVEAICNGKPLLVTPTIRDMLEHLHLYRLAPQRPLWIDAICINQYDMDEKAIQIPSMHNVFSQAAQVSIWMGIATADTDAFMAEFPRVSDIARNWVSTGTDPYAPEAREACTWPTDSDPFWRGYFYLLHEEWAQRLWTFQEAVLAQKAIILCGASRIDLDDFLNFVIEGRYGTTTLYIPEAPNYSCRSLFAFEGFKAIRIFRDHIKGSGVVEAHNIPHLLSCLRHRRMKERVDRVWAVTGLFDKDVQKDLAPKVDYSIGGRKDYSRTFVDFAKVILARSGSLSLLSLPPLLEPRQSCLPSWCPDFSGQGACFQRIVGGWIHPVSDLDQNISLPLHEERYDKEKCNENNIAVRNHSGRCFWTSETDNFLRVRGFCVDTVSETIESAWIVGPTNWATNLNWALVNIQNPSFVAAMSWESQSLALARRIFHGENDAVSSIPREYLMTLLQDCRISDETAIAYTDAMSVLRSNDPEKEFNQFEFPWVTRVGQWISSLSSLCGHTFFSTTGGRIGIATPGCKPGDKICVLYGGYPLYILRWPGCGNSPDSSSGGAIVEFKGVAFVPHLMEQHRSADARLGEDEIFSIG